MKLLIIKTGATFGEIKEKYGDFEDFIINKTHTLCEEVVTIPVYETKILPNINEFSAVIITGSHSMVTDCEDWNFYTREWLKEAASTGVPILGICYGHQLIAETFGGVVGYHPKGKEVGTVNISLTEEGIRDPLIGSMPVDFIGHVTHAQTVLQVPPNAKVLAHNEFEQHHAFSINNSIWGVQFHPEFNEGIVRMYIDKQKEVLVKEGQDVDMLYDSLKEHEYGDILLKRFLELGNK